MQASQPASATATPKKPRTKEPPTEVHARAVKKPRTKNDATGVPGTASKQLRRAARLAPPSPPTPAQRPLRRARTSQDAQAVEADLPAKPAKKDLVAAAPKAKRGSAKQDSKLVARTQKQYLQEATINGILYCVGDAAYVGMEVGRNSFHGLPPPPPPPRGAAPPPFLCPTLRNEEEACHATRPKANTYGPKHEHFVWKSECSRHSGCYSIEVRSPVQARVNMAGIPAAARLVHWHRA